LVVLSVGSYHSNPFFRLPFSNVYGVTLTIAKHPRTGGGRGGPAEGSGQMLKAGIQCFASTMANPAGVIFLLLGPNKNSERDL
jgi:hypothetical protein